MELCLAVDVGGTKLEAGLVTTAGEVLERARVPTPVTEDPEVLFGELSNLVTVVTKRAEPAAQGARIVGCGIGCGGPMSRAEGRVSPLNIPAWRAFPIVERLEQITDLRVALDNDAKALALGEGWVGAARGASAFMGMVVSTGVGGGIVVDGRLIDGASGNAGHVGHVNVEPDGRRCSCGAHGCLEAEASGRAIAEITGRPAADATPEIHVRTGRLVGRAVASVANLLDLDLAVVGGSVALGFGERFFAAANAELKERARLAFSEHARIVPAGLGELAPLVGAGAVAWRAAGYDLSSY